LTPAWQTAPMSKASVAADIHQPLDIHIHFAPEVALDGAFTLNNGGNPAYLFLTQIAYSRIFTYIR